MTFDTEAADQQAVKVKPGRHLATQTEYPWRTAIGAGVVTLISVLGALAAALADPQVSALITRFLPESWAAAILGFGVACGVIVTVLHRIGNLPAVAALRTRLGIGPVPKKNLTSS